MNTEDAIKWLEGGPNRFILTKDNVLMTWVPDGSNFAPVVFIPELGKCFHVKSTTSAYHVDYDSPIELGE